jgi:hypothetical protein
MHAHGLTQYSPEAAEAFSFPSKPELNKDVSPPLFQTPQQPLASICPQHWPGIDAESTDMLLKVLEDNHSRWHVFFNYKGFHKCVLKRICVLSTNFILKPCGSSPSRNLGDGRKRQNHIFCL